MTSAAEQSFRYPLRWRLADAAEAAAARLWPRRLSGLTGYALLAPALALVFILALGLVYILDQSLHELDLSTYRLEDAYSLSNYRAFLDQGGYQRVLARTIAAAALVTAITLALAFPYAYLMVRTRRPAVRKFLLVSLFLPFFIGQVVRAYGWLIILGREGLINALLVAIGSPPLDLIFNYAAVIIGLVQYMLPFGVLLLAPAVTAIGEEVELASEGLGASWAQTLWHVTLPMARPGLIGAGVVIFTLTLTDFAMPEILGGGTSDFMANAVYDGFFQLSNPGLGAALAIILVAVGTLFATGLFALAGTGALAISRTAR